MKRTKLLPLLLLALIVAISLSSCSIFAEDGPKYAIDVDSVPEFDGYPYVIINNNKPFFEDDDIVSEAYEFYSELDGLGRCGYAMACIGIETMPEEDEKRGSISSVTPSGWQSTVYETSLIKGGYLYNRAHLIGWQLTAENANKKNLITGTRFMNVSGMLEFEDMVAAYIKDTGNHVIYRVTPIFKGHELVARGVLMEAVSVEDGGEGIEFCVYIYNNQPGIRIDYSDGNSKRDDGVPFPEDTEPLPGDDAEVGYVINTSTKKIHTSDCTYADETKYNNLESHPGPINELVDDGYECCKVCKPE